MCLGAIINGRRHGVIDAVNPPPVRAPFSFLLLQNYPNPFNPSTTINYDLPKSVYVTLAVYDALGRRVALLVDENKDAGSYRVLFDATKLPSGVYFYSLDAGTYHETKKLLLLK